MPRPTNFETLNPYSCRVWGGAVKSQPHKTDTLNPKTGEPRLGRSSKRPDEENRDMEMVNRLKIDTDDHKKFENYCEDYIESREDMITKVNPRPKTLNYCEDYIESREDMFTKVGP